MACAWKGTWASYQDRDFAECYARISGASRVNLDDLERIAVPAMRPTRPDETVIIDEIGKMECFSPLFKDTLLEILNSANLVLGSIALKGNRFIEAVKERSDVSLVVMSRANRDGLTEVIAGRMKRETLSCRRVPPRRTDG